MIVPDWYGIGVEDLGVATTRLFLSVQAHLFDELARCGHGDVRSRHGVVLAHLGEGARATDLSARSGRSKQTVTRLVDELEQMGYVTRGPDPQDRRGKIIVPSDRGRSEMLAAREILAELEVSCAAALGEEAYTTWRTLLAQLLDQLIPAATGNQPKRKDQS